MPKILNNKNVLTLTLILSDVFSASFAFFAAYFLRNKGVFRHFLDVVQPIEVYLAALPFAIFILIVIFFFAGFYEPKKRRTQISEMHTAFKTITIWILLIMAGSYLYKFDYSRIIVILYYLFTLCFVIFGRTLTRNLQAKLSSYGFGNINILIVGYGKKAREIEMKIKEYKSVGFNFAGFAKASLNLAKIIKERQVDEVYIADTTLSPNKILNIVAKCASTNAKFKIASNIFDLVAGNVNIADLDSIPSLNLKKANFAWWKTVYKRVFDIGFCALTLIFAIPIMAVICIAIAIDSHGKTIISQIRVGKNGKLFKIYKFRTMQNNSPLYTKSPKEKNDKRVTKIGRFLRRTSLDELPQLINVLKGEMSIVGPRPEMPFIVKKYNYWEKTRLAVKPGLTGLWQILGRKDIPLNENLEYDFYYINNQSFFLDLVIILKTIPVILKGTGAY